MDTLVDLSAILVKGDNLNDFLFALLYTLFLLKKGSSLKGKNFFPFSVDPFSDGDKNSFKIVASLEMYLFPLN